MKIETKYNIGDDVWHCNNKLHKVIIEQISVVVKECRKFCIKPFIETQILYWIGYTWAKIEDYSQNNAFYNIIIQDMKKIDVYEQIMMNIDVIVDILWEEIKDGK